MDRSEVLTLVSVTYTMDEFNQQIPQETTKDIFCQVDSIGRDEWYEAGRDDLNTQFKFTVLRYEYSGEPIVIYKGERYAVYRTYAVKGEGLELYAESKVGV